MLGWVGNGDRSAGGAAIIGRVCVWRRAAAVGYSIAAWSLQVRSSTVTDSHNASALETNFTTGLVFALVASGGIDSDLLAVR